MALGKIDPAFWSRGAFLGYFWGQKCQAGPSKSEPLAITEPCPHQPTWRISIATGSKSYHSRLQRNASHIRQGCFPGRLRPRKSAPCQASRQLSGRTMARYLPSKPAIGYKLDLFNTFGCSYWLTVDDEFDFRQLEVNQPAVNLDEIEPGTTFMLVIRL